ncbi:MAG: sodium:calcium antiporter [Clostridiales bacterium]|nr:sodium:calcium antiporter [Clostridiales bacterium]
MPDWLVYIGYAAMVAVIVTLSIKLGKYVDIIDSKSNISGAFIGGVMLAAVTSLPELFTSLSAVWIVHENSMIIGNILGSDLINLAFFGVILLIFGRGLKKAEFSAFYYVALGVVVGMYALTAIGLYLADYMRLTWFSAVSPVILVLYILFVSKMPKTSEADEQESDDGITLKQAVVRFLICAVILIGASIAMTYLTDMVADKLELGKTFAGALFLGVATSLPELISSATLCYRGNYNAAAGNIIGSNVFNFAILFVADVLSFMPDGSGIYILNGDSKWLLIFGAMATVTTAVMMFVKNKFKHKRGVIYGVQAINTVPAVLYVLYLLISTAVIVA